MSIAKRVLLVLATAALVFQLTGCGQQRPAGGGGNQQGTQQDTAQQKADTARDTTTQPQDTTQDTAR